MLYTTGSEKLSKASALFYQDFKDTFVCYTQQCNDEQKAEFGCFIRISKILLYAIHNGMAGLPIV